MWTTMGWEGAGFASTPWKMMRAASLSNHVCAGKWDNFFLLSLYPSIYFLSLCSGSPLTHFVILLTSPHARITHVFLKKKVDRKNWYTETACSNGESQTQTRYMPSHLFFRLLFAFFFAFFFYFFWCDKWYHLAHVPPNTTRVVNVHNR